MAAGVSALALLGVLVLGLGIGAGSTFFYLSQVAHPSTFTTSSISSSSAVSSSSSTVSSSSTASSSDMLQQALKSSQNATLGLASYEFGKGTLVMWVTNNDTSPIILAPQFVVYNNTYQSDIFFTILDLHVIQYGLYAYMPPGSEIIIQVVPNPPPLTPSVANVTILNNNYTFKYGTSK